MTAGALDSGQVSAPDRLWELATLFFRLGAISFGGPAGHVALMEQEVVHKRRWMSREYFLDLLAASNLVPGPNATEMASYIGYLRASWAGLLVAGAAFILPSFAITLALAWAYARFGSLPQAGALLYGIKPAVIGIIAVAVWRLGRSALADRTHWALFALVLAATLLRVDDVLLLLASGLLMVAWLERARLPWLGLLALGCRAPALGAAMGREGADHLAQIFFYFLKVGAVLYGSGLVLYAFIQRDVVINLRWLSQQQLADAIAAGQITPGPVSSSATFIGYLIGGPSGAALATLGIFLPSFIVVALTGPLIPRLRNWRMGQAFLRGAMVAALALILKTGFLLASAALVDAWSVLIALASVFLLWRYEVDAAWVVAGGVAVGLLRFLAMGT